MKSLISKSTCTLFLVLISSCSMNQPKDDDAIVRPIAENAEVAEMKTAAPDIIVVELTMTAEECEHIPDMTKSLWRVNGVEPAEIYRYSVPWDQTYDSMEDLTMRHFIYLVLNTDLISGSDYEIQTPYETAVFHFNEQISPCLSIKVNQAAYNIESSSREAVFGMFLGDGGSRTTDTLRYHVRNADTDVTVYSGTGDAFVFDELSGEYTSLLDLSSVTSEGTYYLYIEGIGRSYDFDINDMEDVAATVFRGLYHQRCGIALEAPYTAYTRGECHSSVAFTKQSTANGTGWIEVPAEAEMHEIHGGYHDAADYDRRAMHTLIPIFMLSYYDIFPDYFTDDQFNIPESGNGIPDYLDEALWGVKLYEYLQLDDSNCGNPEEYGGVMMGTEANRHPGWGRSAATDNLVYGTYNVTGHSTASAAGMFAHAARLIRPYDAAKANELQERAVAAWNYLEDNPEMKTELESQLMYASLQLYLATASGNASEDMNNEYHVRFRGYVRDILIDNSTGWPRQYKPGYLAISHENASMTFSPYFMAYLFTSFAREADLAADIESAVIRNADSMASLVEAQRYPIGAQKSAWASYTGQGWTADVLCMGYALTGDSRYYDSVSRLADFDLGLNALGRSYITGLGDVQLRSPLHLDSYFTRYGIPPHTTPIGTVPGIIVYGATGGRSDMPYQLFVSDKIYPLWDDMPTHRRFGDSWTLVNSCEFTTWETLVSNVCMYSFLHGEAAR